MPLCLSLQLDDGALTLPVPWASIALALFLTIFGVVSFVLAWLHFTQKLLGKERAVRMGRSQYQNGHATEPAPSAKAMADTPQFANSPKDKDWAAFLHSIHWRTSCLSIRQCLKKL